MRKKGGRLGHFDGWEVGAVAVLIALLGTLLAVPLPVVPNDVPMPLVDGKSLASTLDIEKQRAEALAAELKADIAKASGLFDLRAFGEEFRAYGAAEAAGDTYVVVRARPKLLQALSRAIGSGEDKLVALRAYQQRLFLAELRRWEDTGDASTELVGLGGGFLDLMRQSGWLRGRTIVMDEVVRGIFFKRRWNQVTGISTPLFAITVDEHRAFYAFLLAHPFVEGRAQLEEKDACRAADRWRLRKVEELRRIDTTYPYALARGVLFSRLDRHEDAVQAFRDYLGSADDGRYTMRARNYLVSELARAAHEP